MPKVTIWIRKEDDAKWKAIENKPEWLHTHLGVDILSNKINGQRVYHVNEKAPQYPAAQVYIDGIPKGGASYPTITTRDKIFPDVVDQILTPPEDTA